MSKRGIQILIDGQPKVLRFNLNALAALEEATGVPIQDGKDKKFGFREQRALVWAGLIHAEPKLTLQQVGELLDPVMEDPAAWGDLLENALKAFGMAFPERPKEESAGGADPNAKSATGGETSSS